MPTHHLKDQNYGSSLVAPYRRSLGKRLTCATTRVSHEQPRTLGKVTAKIPNLTRRDETLGTEMKWRLRENTNPRDFSLPGPTTSVFNIFSRDLFSALIIVVAETQRQWQTVSEKLRIQNRVVQQIPRNLEKNLHAETLLPKTFLDSDSLETHYRLLLKYMFPC